ncbi:DUF4468 domain-containing protein [Myroides sp. LJL115]
MKKLFLISLALFSIKSYSQKLIRDEISRMYKLDTIVNTIQDKQILYSNALDWVASKNRDANTEILSKDESRGEILFSAKSESYVVVEEIRKKKIYNRHEVVAVYFIGKIIVKDGKYRLIFSDLEKSFLTSIRIPLVPSMLDNVDSGSIEAFNDLKMYQESFIKSMHKQSDSDF